MGSETWKIWCDGSCKNDTECAWGAVIDSPEGIRKEYSAKLKINGSSLVAEIYAIIESLNKIPEKSSVIVYTDCKSIADRCTNLPNTVPKSSAAQIKQAWRDLNSILPLRDVKIEWIKGHAKSVENNLADKLAKKHLSHINAKPQKAKTENKETPKNNSLFEQEDIPKLFENIFDTSQIIIFSREDKTIGVCKINEILEVIRVGNIKGNSKILSFFSEKKLYNDNKKTVKKRFEVNLKNNIQIIENIYVIFC